MNAFRVGALLMILGMTLSSLAPKSDDPDAVLGRWLSSKKRNQVQIYKQGNKYYGKLVWMQEPIDPVTKKPKVDSENPDENLRSRPLMQMILVSNLSYKGNNVWGDGEVYNPEDGKTYGCEITLRDPNAIDMRGYVMGISMLGKTRTWTRVK
ncbi:DUF2147 domain-containing protein [Spirosoma sp. BT702]|uniref:DUF2147 domain-containing protein n=1 Tax=Spirosoma profusum TaxID=2771354 RepID=A0A926Y4U4_9BACT|nr:DUF2147 domain-containing protein [Spirosoma profusum]MBD2703745.1 DUF2147 domain-containing protein [Spirosoma profusum]